MRTQDPRLEVAVASAREFRERARQAQEAIRARIPDDAVNPLVDQLLGLAGGQPPPAGLDPDVTAVWSTVARAVDEHSELAPAEGAQAALLDRLGAGLAQRCRGTADDLERLFMALERLGSTSAEDTFVDRLDVADINAHLGEFSRPPTEEEAFQVDTFGRLRERSHQIGYLEELSGRRKRGGSRWELVEWAAQPADEMGFNPALRFRSALHRRAGLRPWLAWVGRLPLHFLQAVALREVTSLDEAQKMVDCLLSEPGTGDLLILAAMRVLELWGTVDANLERNADPRWTLPPVDEAARQRATEALAEWREHEFPWRMVFFATSLVEAGAPGRELAVLMLRSLFVARMPPQRPAIEERCVPPMRDMIIVGLLGASTSLAELLDALLAPPVTPASLLSAAGLVLETDQATPLLGDCKTRVWRAYGEHLANSETYWAQWLVGDDQTLAWMLAGVLASFEAPAATWEALVRTVRVAREGWGFDYEAYFNSLPRVAHVLVVGSMATEWLLRAERVETARALFTAVWAELHRWLRWLTPPPPGCELMAIGQVWARLLHVHREGGADLAHAALLQLDRPEWILSAAEHLVQNPGAGNERVLPSRLRQLISLRFPPMLELMRRSPGLQEGELTVLETRFGALISDPPSLQSAAPGNS